MLGHIIMICNKKHAIARYEEIVPIDVPLCMKKRFLVHGKKSEVLYLSNHGPGEASDMMNNLMIYKCIRNEQHG